MAGHSSLFFRSLIPAALVSAALACKDENKLYSYHKGAEASPTPAATVPSTAAPAIPDIPEHAGVLQRGPSSGSIAADSFIPPAADRPRLPKDAKTRSVSFEGVSFSVPDAWTSRPPASQMRLAEMALPPVGEGDRGGELAVFYFGPGGGGGMLDNVTRWVGQMELKGDVPPVLYRQTRGSLTATEVICFGTQKPSSMGVGPSEAIPNSGLHGLIVEGSPKGSLFVKMTGSEAAIRAADPAVASLIDSLEPASP